MNSLKALKQIEWFSRVESANYKEFSKNMDIIKRDLEVLEIIKKEMYLEIDEIFIGSDSIEMIPIPRRSRTEEYNKIKEWLNG